MNEWELSPHLDQIPPQALDAEQAVLGCCLIDTAHASIDVCREMLRARDFYREAHTRIFEAIVALDDAEEPVDILTVANELERVGALDQAGGRAYLMACVDMVPTVARAPSYCQRIVDNAILRGIIALSGEVMGMAYARERTGAEILEDAQQRFFLLQSRGTSGAPLSLRDVVMGVEAEISQMEGSGARVRGIPTGFARLDGMLSGFQRGELIIVAGRPSMGKSSIAMSFLLNAAGNAVPSIAFSLEMSSKSLGYRLLSQDAEIDSKRLESGDLRSDSIYGDETVRFTHSVAKLMEMPIWVDDRTDRRIGEIRAITRRWKQQHGVEMIAVDYVQLMARSASDDQMRHELGRISVGLKALAKELGIAVLLLSQLSRRCEQREDHRPRLSDLAESGNLEADADVVLFPFRPAYYERGQEDDKPKAASERAEIIVAKQRNGPTGTVPITFVGPFGCYMDAS